MIYTAPIFSSGSPVSFDRRSFAARAEISLGASTGQELIDQFRIFHLQQPHYGRAEGGNQRVLPPVFVYENLRCEGDGVAGGRDAFDVVEAALFQSGKDHAGENFRIELGVERGGGNRYLAFEFGEVGHLIGQRDDRSPRTNPDAFAAIDAPVGELHGSFIANADRGGRADAQAGHASVASFHVKSQ